MISYLFVLCLLSTNYAQDQPALCQYRNQDPGRHCLEIEETITTDEDRQAVLDKMNNRRNKVAAGEIKSLPAASNMSKLEWNTELEYSANKWAKQCVRSSVPDLKDACRHLANMRIGQNIATIFGESPGLKPTALVDVWYMELLHINSSVLSKFIESNASGSHYEYFTQLMWSDTTQVGCGGVKFKEKLKDSDGRNRTVYRLVCNFAPEGNHGNQSVYLYGTPCSRCPKGTTCDAEYKALCGVKMKREIKQLPTPIKTTPISPTTKTTTSRPTTSKLIETTKTTDTLTTIEDDTFTPFDFFSHLHEFIRQPITATPKTVCKDILAVDEFIDVLRKKLSSDTVFKDLIFSTKYQTYNTTENSFTDAKVAAFMNKIYSKKEPTTTTRATENDLLNSTFLVDLVEAVIFRSGDKLTSPSNSESSVQDSSNISPVKIQAELGEIQQNNDFTGHYFFPEDDEYTTTEPVDAYYDSSPIAVKDIMAEIEDIKKSTTSDFLEQILELESSTDSTTTTSTTMMPDVLTSYQSGRNIMKKFLEEIREKSTSSYPLG